MSSEERSRKRPIGGLCHLTFKVMVVERDTNAVEPEATEKFGIGVHEKVLEELGQLVDQDDS